MTVHAAGLPEGVGFAFKQRGFLGCSCTHEKSFANALLAEHAQRTVLCRVLSVSLTGATTSRCTFLELAVPFGAGADSGQMTWHEFKR